MAVSSNSGQFPFECLPLHLQEQILSLLPLTSLLRLRAVSSSFISLLSSTSFLSHLRLHHHRLHHHFDDLFFLLFVPISTSTSTSMAAAFHPSTNRFLRLPIPSSLLPISSSSSLLISSAGCGGDALAAVRLLSNSTAHPIPPIPPGFYLLAVISDDSPSFGKFKLVAVSTGQVLLSQIYDSRVGSWSAAGELPARFAFVGNAAYLPRRRRLFAVARVPDRLLAFDPDAGGWALLAAGIPPRIAGSHLFAFEEGLFLVGGVEQFGVVVRIVVWEMDWEPAAWRELCAMPEEMFAEFVSCPTRFYHFQAVDRMGLVCLNNAAEPQRVAMLDVTARAGASWRWLPPCHMIPEDMRAWFGHAAEPCVDLLTPSLRRS